MAQIMDGKALAKKIKEQVAAEAATLPRRPGLAVILVGENPASQVYVRGKEKDCEECGILNLGCKIPAETSEEELLRIIAEMNAIDKNDATYETLLNAKLKEGQDIVSTIYSVSYKDEKLAELQEIYDRLISIYRYGDVIDGFE